MSVDYAVVNKNQQVRKVEVKCDDATDDPHYEEVPLPDDNQIQKWKLSLAESDKKIKNDKIPDNTEVNGKPSDRKESKRDFCKESAYDDAYEDIPAIQGERKKKGMFRFSNAFKRNDIKDPKPENKSDRKNRTKSQRTECSGQNEMLNARERVSVNKYPYYAAVQPVRDSKRTESFIAQNRNRGMQREDEKSSTPYYHVLEGNSEVATSGDEDVEHNGHSYHILEQVSLNIIWFVALLLKPKCIPVLCLFLFHGTVVVLTIFSNHT